MAKRESIGTHLKKAREATGMSVPQLMQKIRDEYGKVIGETTIRDTEKDRTPNPSIKVIEFIAIALRLDPLEVISLGLDDPPELEPGFKVSQFAQLWKSYSKLEKGQRPLYDEFLKMLIERMDRPAQKAASASRR
jgi:transcriptional regulator with XRE-family HTH domain